MLYSRIYKEYFPLKHNYTFFTDNEKKIISKWINTFRQEVRIREYSLLEKGYNYIPTYRLYDFNK